MRIEDGTITEVTPRGDAPAGEVPPGATVVDGRGRILIPSFADVHVHLDSTRVGLPFRPHTGSPGVWNMMLNDRRNWRDAEVSMAERTTTTLGRMIAHGTTAVRTYAQVDVDCGSSGSTPCSPRKRCTRAAPTSR